MSFQNDDDILQSVGGRSKNSLSSLLFDNLDQNDLDIQNEIHLLNESSYYSDNLIEKLIPHTNSFSVLSLNTESIFTSFNELRIFVNYLHISGFQFSAICLQECWLPKQCPDQFLNLPGYTRFSTPETCGRKGGLITFVNECFHSGTLKLSRPFHDRIWECHFLEISGGNLNKRIYLGNIYRPPRDSFEIFEADLHDILTELTNSNNELIITGDFNINLLQIDNNMNASNFFSATTSFGLYPKITLPTRFSATSASLIDNTFCKISPDSTSSFSGIMIKRFSDHQPHFVCFNDLRTKPKKKTPKTITINPQPDIECFKTELLNVDYDELLSNIDVNTNVKEFVNLLSQTKNKLAPPKIIPFNKYKHRRDPWTTKGILTSIEVRDIMYKEHLLITNPFEKGKLKDKINKYNQIIRRLLRLSRTSYYNDLFELYKHDSRKTWRCINEIIGKKMTKSSLPEYFEHDGKTIRDPLFIAEEFNKFFSQIGHQYASALDYTENGFRSFLKSHDHDLNCDTSNHTFEFEPISETDILKILDDLKSKNSHGIDGLSSKLLKSLKTAIAKPISILINQSFLTGIFPDCLKIAKVIPIYKKDNNKLFSNYRPISLLPALSKAFEKAIFIQLYSYFDSNNLFFESQYGFRTRHSTETATLELVNRVLTAFESNLTPISIFLDLSKAFDTLEHRVLLEKLKFYGIHNTPLRLLENYLSKNRFQYVNYHGHHSSLLPLSIGVPQGSILGPLLFIIYMNDINHASKLFHFILYADDTSLLSTSTLCKDISNIDVNQEFNKICSWLKENRLSLNIDKTKCMIFHHPNKKNITKPRLYVSGTEIEYVDSFKFLGITVDKHLSWNQHIKTVCTKIKRAAGVIGRLKHILPIPVKLKLYHSLIGSHLNYGILVWGRNISHNNKLFVSQKQAIRAIVNSRYNAHSCPIFKRLRLLKVSDLYLLAQIKFYNNFKLHKLPYYLQNLPILTNNEMNEDYPRTRGAKKLHNLHGNPNLLQVSIPSTINNLPAPIRNKLLHHNYLYGTASIVHHYKSVTLDLYSDIEICTDAKCFPCRRFDNII